jgi:tetratricopeptide (TPR) repeat protein
MIGLIVPLLGAALGVAVTNSTPAPSSGPIDPASGFSVSAPVPVDPAEAAYRRLLALDDEAQEDMDRWIREADELGDRVDAAALQQRIDQRIAGVEKVYREFLVQYPDHVRARIAYGSFLNDTGRELPAREQWERALELDPRNPAIHNNLAGSYGHRGPVTNAFVHYEKAIELDPKEPVYYQNFATTVFLFRRDVMEHYAITNEQAVFDKALTLYRRAMELDPSNFILASDLAQTFYGIKPSRHDEALAAWRTAYDLASDDLEREGVRVHLARLQIQAGRFDEARSLLTQITNTNYAMVKGRLEKTLAGREAAAAAPAAPAKP